MSDGPKGDTYQWCGQRAVPQDQVPQAAARHAGEGRDQGGHAGLGQVWALQQGQGLLPGQDQVQVQLNRK